MTETIESRALDEIKIGGLGSSRKRVEDDRFIRGKGNYTDDVVLHLTEWPEFRNPDFELIRRLLAGHFIFDGRNIYDERTMAQYGFTYYGIGRGKR